MKAYFPMKKTLLITLFSRLIGFLGETEERGKKIFKEWH